MIGAQERFVLVARAVALMILLLSPVGQVLAAGSSQRGLTIVVTFPSLYADVRALSCDVDNVISLVPPGVDPHEFELSPGSVRELAEADVIVSTLHAPFELQIHNLWAQGALRATLIEIPKLGLRFFENPVTNATNYHMPVFDPFNFMIFARALSTTLAKLNPSAASCYEQRLLTILTNISTIIARAPPFACNAVGEAPFVQYSVEWAGINVVGLIMAEEGIEAPPSILSQYNAMAASGALGCVVLSEPPASPSAHDYLVRFANEYHLKAITVPSEEANVTVVHRMELLLAQIAGQAPETSATSPAQAGQQQASAPWGLISWALLVVVVILLAYLAYSMVVAARRR
ncbi:MAG: zinc ABC transporter substrate-binding protein [Desulfurococcaceae archaeon]